MRAHGGVWSFVTATERGGAAALPWGSHFVGTMLAPDATEIVHYLHLLGGAEVAGSNEERKISAHLAIGFTSIADFMSVASAALLVTGGGSSEGGAGGAGGGGGRARERVRCTRRSHRLDP